VDEERAVSTDPADMLGPTITVTPAGEQGQPPLIVTLTEADIALIEHATSGNHGAIGVDFPPVPDEAEDVYQAAYDAYRAIPGTIDLNRTRIRAVVDVAVRITEERVRAEYGEELAAANSVMEMADGALDQMAANLAKAEENQAAINERLSVLTGDVQRLVDERNRALDARDLAEVDAAQLRAAAGPATGWASAADLQAAYTDLLRRLEVAEVDRDTLADQLKATEVERDALAQRARVVDVTQINDAGTRSLCNTCGHEQFTPARPLYATESAERASVVPPDPDGAEDGSGGRVEQADYAPGGGSSTP
jgi:hypothetical protein